MSSELITAEKLYDVLSGAERSNEPSWLRIARDQGHRNYLEHGFPHRKVESWRYTNIEKALKFDYTLGCDTDLSEEDVSSLRIANAAEVVFVNGVFSEKLSRIPRNVRGLTLLPLLEGCDEAFVQDYLEEPLPDASDCFTQLNRATFRDGFMVSVERTIDHPIHLLHISSDSEAAAQVSALRNCIHLTKGASAVLIESYQSLGDKPSLNLPVTNIKCDHNANLRYCRIQQENTKSYHFGSTSIKADESAQVESLVFAAGAQISRHNLDTELNGARAEVHLNGLFLTKGNMLADNRTVINHNVEDTVSRQLYKGILDERSRGVFCGRVHIEKDAQRSDSAQMCRNLLLSKAARIDAKPELDVKADDVKAAHGATIGQLDADQIFYLQSRNISRESAAHMLTRGFMEEIIEKAPSCVYARLESLILAYFELKGK